jgi:hypothetical protein
MADASLLSLLNLTGAVWWRWLHYCLMGEVLPISSDSTPVGSRCSSSLLLWVWDQACLRLLYWFQGWLCCYLLFWEGKFHLTTLLSVTSLLWEYWVSQGGSPVFPSDFCYFGEGWRQFFLWCLTGIKWLFSKSLLLLDFLVPHLFRVFFLSSVLTIIFGFLAYSVPNLE